MVRNNKINKVANEGNKSTSVSMETVTEETRKHRRSASKFLRYPGEESPCQQKQQGSQNDKEKISDGKRKKLKLSNKLKASRRIIFHDENNSTRVDLERNEVSVAIPGTSTEFSSNENSNATGLQKPNPNVDWIGGVERRLLNKLLPQGSKENEVNECVRKKLRDGNLKKANVSNQQVETVASGCNKMNDGINLHVEADELDYIDDIPNPQDPENERLVVSGMEDPVVLEVEADLDDSDGLEKGATASNLMSLARLVQDEEDLENMSKKERQEFLQKNPGLRSLLSELLDEKLKEVIPGGRVIAGKNLNSGKANRRAMLNCDKGKTIKSPSDTTIYAPVLNMDIQKELNNLKLGSVNNKVVNPAIRPQVTSEEEITKFLESVRINNANNAQVVNPNVISGFVDQRQVREVLEPSTSRRPDNSGKVEQAKDRAQKTLVEAEKFKAAIIDPPGMYIGHQLGSDLCAQPYEECIENLSQNGSVLDKGTPNLQTQLPVQHLSQTNAPVNTMNMNLHGLLDIRKGVSDDDFFHLTCHIEPNLIHKIEKGEFIELEKLLPKDRLSAGKFQDEGRLEWMQRDGGTYLVPATRDSKITGIRRWEQAFRAYATIYCGANPYRAKEIWQYIAVINTAAASCTWDNVYNYDITFRHLMAFNPQRSWAITYNQMWNLSMKDPLPRNQHKFGSTNYNSQNGSAKGSGNGKFKHKKSDYCWNYNRGVKCKFGSKCRFIERCSYCDSGAHALFNCPKKKQKTSGEAGTAGGSAD